MIGKEVMKSKIRKITPFIVLSLVVLLILSVAFQLNLPAPTGVYEVGETVLRWIDSARPEVMTDNLNDHREVIALVWYPAESGSGTRSPYFPELSKVSKSLIKSGEVAAWQVFGLPFIRSHNVWNAVPAKNEKPYPVVIFSPGNGTNIEFYTVVASELASHGYTVVGLNHPYDVAAVELSNHQIATDYKEQDSLEPRHMRLLLQSESK